MDIAKDYFLVLELYRPGWLTEPVVTRTDGIIEYHGREVPDDVLERLLLLLPPEFLARCCIISARTREIIGSPTFTARRREMGPPSPNFVIAGIREQGCCCPDASCRCRAGPHNYTAIEGGKGIGVAEVIVQNGLVLFQHPEGLWVTNPFNSTSMIVADAPQIPGAGFAFAFTRCYQLRDSGISVMQFNSRQCIVAHVSWEAIHAAKASWSNPVWNVWMGPAAVPDPWIVRDAAFRVSTSEQDTGFLFTYASDHMHHREFVQVHKVWRGSILPALAMYQFRFAEYPPLTAMPLMDVRLLEHDGDIFIVIGAPLTEWSTKFVAIDRLSLVPGAAEAQWRCQTLTTLRHHDVLPLMPGCKYIYLADAQLVGCYICLLIKTHFCDPCTAILAFNVRDNSMEFVRRVNQEVPLFPLFPKLLEPRPDIWLGQESPHLRRSP